MRIHQFHGFAEECVKVPAVTGASQAYILISETTVSGRFVSLIKTSMHTYIYTHKNTYSMMKRDGVGRRIPRIQLGLPQFGNIYINLP